MSLTTAVRTLPAALRLRARWRSALLAACALLGACESPTAPPVPPATLVAIAPFEQVTTVAAAVPVPPAVRALDGQGRPIARLTIEFTIVEGNGAISAGSAITDADGHAALASWHAGTRAGFNRVRAGALAGGPAVIFVARGEAAQPVKLGMAVQPATLIPAGTRLSTPAVVEIRDAWDNHVRSASARVTAVLQDGSVPIAGTMTRDAVDGRATFADLVPSAIGAATLRFTAPGLEPVTAATFVVPAVRMCGGFELRLDLALGEHVRFRADAVTLPSCLRFDHGAHAGREFLVLFENYPVNGAYGNALFFAAANDPAQLTAQISGGLIEPVVTAGADAAPITQHARHGALPEGTRHAWDFGGGPIYEGDVALPPGGAPPARLLRRGATLDVNAAGVSASVGDTLVVRMAGIDRLNIATGDQRAVIRHVSEHLIIAEDVRLSTLLRGNGRVNSPLRTEDMQAIVAQYEAYGAPLLDALFLGRSNNTVESRTPRRHVAVHSLTSADNVWGYTYSSTDYFVFDFWVGSNGSTPTLAQHPQRVADNLFTHEISHMRHWGLNERAGRNTAALRGNRWLVEGFATFVERLPIAARLLDQPLPVRTGNIRLPLNPAFEGSWYRGDVAEYAPAGFFQGYEHAGWFFDYLADQVAFGGGDWLAALRDVLVHGGVQPDLDAAIGRAVPGSDFGSLLTRARLALYLDDIGTTGLPPWTQFHQYQLRASRPALGRSDPRTVWPRFAAGLSFARTIGIGPGQGWGFIIDGTASLGSALIELDAGAVTNGAISITRIR